MTTVQSSRPKWKSLRESLRLAAPQNPAVGPILRQRTATSQEQGLCPAARPGLAAPANRGGRGHEKLVDNSARKP